MTNPTPIEIRSSVIHCKKCPLHINATHPIPWSGNSPNTMAVIGEAPGATEDKEGKPFVGPAGRLLRSWMDRFGFDPAYLNVVSCFPHRTPRQSEVDACRENLWNQLQVIRPTYILCFGTVAVSSWFKNIGIEKIRGTFWQASWNDEQKEVGNGWSWAFATYHPAAILRNVDMVKAVMEDLAWFDQCLKKGQPAIRYVDECIGCGTPVEKVMYGVGFCAVCYRTNAVSVRRKSPDQIRLF